MRFDDVDGGLVGDSFIAMLFFQNFTWRERLGFLDILAGNLESLFRAGIDRAIMVWMRTEIDMISGFVGLGRGGFGMVSIGLGILICKCGDVVPFGGFV